ncbi:MAG: EAL domain-containing protein [Candidatus Aceula meridiana]|nr:EAL domain-containing protein [Candidatus Aceula meridiana]
MTKRVNRIRHDPSNYALSNAPDSFQNSLLKNNSPVDPQKFLSKDSGLFKTIVDYSYDWEIFRDKNGEILYVSPGIERVTGYKPEDYMTGKINFENLFFGEDLEKIKQYFKKAKDGESFNDAEFRILRRNKKTAYVSISVQPVKDGCGNFIGFRSSIRDITQRKKMENELEFLSTITQQISDSIIVTDLKFRIIFVNKATENLYGYTKRELVGRSPEFLNAEPLRRKIECQIYKTVRRGDSWSGQHLNRRKDESVFTCEFKISPICNQDGEVYCYCSVQRDVTEREQSRKAMEMQRDLGTSLSSAHSQVEAFNHILDTALQVEGIDCGGIYLVSRNGQSVDLLAHRGLKYAFTRSVSHFNEHHPESKMVKAGKPFYGSYPKIMQESDFVKVKEGLLSLAVVPVFYDGEVVASLNLGSHTCQEILLSSRAKIEAIASRIGGVLVRLNAEKCLEENFNFLKVLFDTSPNPIFFKDSHGVYRACNRAFADCLGRKEGEILGKTIFDLAPKAAAESYDKADRELMEKKGRQVYESKVLFGDGTCHDIMFFKAASLKVDKEVGGIVGFMLDITKRKEMEREFQRNALHDSLTNIPNRRLFMQNLMQAMQRARRNEGYRFAILFLDLDHFKDINDGLGHLIGDKIILEISRKLKKCVRANDTVSRFGGDEFAILLDNIEGLDDAIDAANRIQITLSNPFVLEGREFFMTGSIGILLNSPEYNFPEEILRDADTAMYKAKVAGRARYAIFDEKMHTSAVRRIQLENDLRKAIQKNEFQVFYQPIVSVKTGRITCVEALLRWVHPEKGMIGPNEFIPLAEETGLIIPITAWVLETAAKQVRQWLDFGYRVRFSVNLSALNLTQKNLAGVIEKTLAQSQIDPDTIELEITETAAMKEFDLALSTLRRLKSIGTHISIDDFGVGYSPLLYLKQFPVSKIKIDMSFIREIPDNLNDMAITEAIIAMAHVLGINVIAEGVETIKQFAFLQERGCDEIQGFLFSRPVPADQITQYFKDGKHLER